MKNRSRPTKAPKTVDELLALASSDPDALEAYRRAQVQSIIDNAPRELRQRLRGLQFTIDARRELHTSALGACIELSQLMLDSYSELQALLNQLGGQANTSEPAEPPAPSAPSATILAFPPEVSGPDQPDPGQSTADQLRPSQPNPQHPAPGQPASGQSDRAETDPPTGK